MKTKLLVIIGMIAIFGALVAGAGLRFNKAAANPNILFIVVDTLRQDALSCYGAPRPTPEIDALAAISTRFDSASCALSVTLPSHASMFTGLYPQRHGVYRNARPVEQNLQTLAETLTAQGYETAACVSSYALSPEIAPGIDQGFQTYGDEGFISPKETTARALRLLDDLRESREPWFLFVHYHDPHTPYTPQSLHYAEEQMDASAERVLDIMKTMQGLPGGIPFEDADLRMLRDLYDDEVRGIDAEIGAILSQVHRPSTVIIFTSDHGEAFGEHDTMGHGFGLWPENYLVPLLIHIPQQPPVVIARPVSHVDIVPTLHGIMKIPADDMDGTNLFHSSDAPVIVEQAKYTEKEIWSKRFPSDSLLIRNPEKPASPITALTKSQATRLKSMGYLQ